jgi:stage V sporulation protein R
LERLSWFDRKIQEVAEDFGLDFFPQEFDIVPAQKMLEIMAYRFPVNFSHWSFGRDYEEARTRYEHGLGIPYEVVLNSDPSRAYLMNTNPLAVQVMVMAHVYGHNDFMKNNFHFKATRRDMLPSAASSALRFQAYEKEHGVERVERLIDAGLSVELNVDPEGLAEEEAYKRDSRRESPRRDTMRSQSAYSELLPRKEPPLGPEDSDPVTGTKRTPSTSERDLLLYILTHSPKPLEEWESDALSVLREQSLYCMPQRRTKIMNEGWAAYWHMRIMDRLFEEGHLASEEHGTYNHYNAQVLASNPRSFNPYLVGLKIFEDIEERWDKGRFGREWEACEDPRERERWDLGLGQGREKMLDVRQGYTDRFFIEAFLTRELVESLELYLYQGRNANGEIQYAIQDRDWRAVKNMLVAYLSNFGIPVIRVEDGDYKGRRELYMKHAYDGIELDDEYRRKTMESIFYLWARPVHLETVLKGKRAVYSYDGSEEKQS